MPGVYTARCVKCALLTGKLEVVGTPLRKVLKVVKTVKTSQKGGIHGAIP